MDCEIAREGLSARLDGEDPPVPAAELDAHLADCPACRAWLEDAHTVTRRARVSLVRPVPDLADAVVAAVVADRAARTRSRRVLAARLGLVAAALAQFVLCVPVLLLGHDREAPLHLAHEMGSFELALVAGCLAAAWSPRRAAGLVPLAGVAAGCLVVTAVLDVAGRQTTAADELPHLLVVASWLLLHELARAATHAPDGPASDAATDPGRHGTAVTDLGTPLPSGPPIAVASADADHQPTTIAC